MSQYKKVIHKLGSFSSYETTHTDHSDEIIAMRSKCAAIMAEHPDATQAPHVAFLEATMLQGAAALLEVHDDTGISLDDWVGPREVVETGLMIAGFSRETFLENHV